MPEVAKLNPFRFSNWLNLQYKCRPFGSYGQVKYFDEEGKKTETLKSTIELTRDEKEKLEKRNGFALSIRKYMVHYFKALDNISSRQDYEKIKIDKSEIPKWRDWCNTLYKFFKEYTKNFVMNDLMKELGIEMKEENYPIIGKIYKVYSGVGTAQNIIFNVLQVLPEIFEKAYQRLPKWDEFIKIAEKAIRFTNEFAILNLDAITDLQHELKDQDPPIDAPEARGLQKGSPELTTNASYFQLNKDTSEVGLTEEFLNRYDTGINNIDDLEERPTITFGCPAKFAIFQENGENLDATKIFHKKILGIVEHQAKNFFDQMVSTAI